MESEYFNEEKRKTLEMSELEKSLNSFFSGIGKAAEFKFEVFGNFVALVHVKSGIAVSFDCGDNCEFDTLKFTFINVSAEEKDVFAGFVFGLSYIISAMDKFGMFRTIEQSIRNFNY